jgi:hypothetical protein
MLCGPIFSLRPDSVLIIYLYDAMGAPAGTGETTMTNATLEYFRSIHEAMQTEAADWQWIGLHMSQRLFGITERRAKEYARRHGGEAKRMEAR